MGMAAILVMWSNSFVQILIPIHLEALIWNLVPNNSTNSEKNKL